MNTKTNFKIAPVEGDWVKYEGKPVYIHRTTYNQDQRLFLILKHQFDSRSYVVLPEDIDPIKLTPAVMGWVKEAEADYSYNGISVFIISMPGIRIRVDSRNGVNVKRKIWMNDQRISSITELHELQQLYRLLSGGQELTIEPK